MADFTSSKTVDGFSLKLPLHDGAVPEIPLGSLSLRSDDRRLHL
jgi:hypothetical protein